MNTELLLKVRDAILAEPLKFDMRDWLAQSENSPCGTTACIAGWAASIHLGHEKLSETARLFNSNDSDDEFFPEEYLDIGPFEQDILFYKSNWPEPFRSQYLTAKNAADRARAAADRIDHFIATNGAE